MFAKLAHIQAHWYEKLNIFVRNTLGKAEQTENKQNKYW